MSAAIVVGAAVSFIVAVVWPGPVTGFGPPVMLTAWWLWYQAIK